MLAAVGILLLVAVAVGVWGPGDKKLRPAELQEIRDTHTRVAMFCHPHMHQGLWFPFPALGATGTRTPFQLCIISQACVCFSLRYYRQSTVGGYPILHTSKGDYLMSHVVLL